MTSTRTTHTARVIATQEEYDVLFVGIVAKLGDVLDAAGVLLSLHEDEAAR